MCQIMLKLDYRISCYNSYHTKQFQSITEIETLHHKLLPPYNSIILEALRCPNYLITLMKMCPLKPHKVDYNSHGKDKNYIKLQFNLQFNK